MCSQSPREGHVVFVPVWGNRQSYQQSCPSPSDLKQPSGLAVVCSDTSLSQRPGLGSLGTNPRFLSILPLKPSFISLPPATLV